MRFAELSRAVLWGWAPSQQSELGRAQGRMEVPVHDVVNTGEETFRNGSGVTGFINVCLNR